MFRFDNELIRALPGDPEVDAARSRQSRQVRNAAWSTANATPVSSPRLVAWSRDMAERLGLTCAYVESAAFAQAFSGNRLLDGMQPWANNYGGHQFGQWAGQLGDGRAISLGEAMTPSGERWELQLKGAGPTPYSRGSDGRAVLRSSLREFLCSEAMFHLGVPTSRALSLMATGDSVVRDMFYDGHPRAEQGAIVCRVAPSFIRFGTFELPASRGEASLLEQLVEFCIRRDFPQLHERYPNPDERRAAWFFEVCERNAELVAHWMRIGFVHGVLNTDNMSILGLTLDYGPYGWIDAFDPDWTPNTTDRQHGRYRFGQQPQIVWWNLSRLAGALSAVFPDQDVLREGLQKFVTAFEAADRRHTADKLGLVACSVEDLALMQTARELMHAGEIDMTLFFRELAGLDSDQPSVQSLDSAFYSESRRNAVSTDLTNWLLQLAARWARDERPDGERRAQMNAANPRFVPRNYLAQEAIDQAERGDFSKLHTLQQVMSRPYDEQPEHQVYASKRPEWARNRPGCSMLSCSS